MLRLRTLGGLWIEATSGTRLPSPRPRRLGVLAILAAAGPRGVSRARLRAIFWPDSTDEAAGHALRQTLYALHQDLGVRAVLADTELRLDAVAISSDLDDFRVAVARRDWETAAGLHQGSFAAGFALEDCPDFERWLAEERIAIDRLAMTALEGLAHDATSGGDRRRTAQAWERLVAIDPFNARYATSYMTALAADGDRSGALTHAKRYAADVRRELDVDPDPTVARLAAELRAAVPDPPPMPPPPPAATEGVRSAPAPSHEPIRHPARRRWLTLAGLGAAILAAVWALVARERSDRPPQPVLAVGRLRDLSEPAGDERAAVLSEVLTTSLARLADAEIIANSRMLELLAGNGDTLPAARIEAARRAGATEVIEGELVPTVDGQLRLDLRRVDVDRGAIRAGYSVSGHDRLALIDSVTILVAADLSIRGPVGALADVTPTSRLALQLYDEGLRAYFRGDAPGAVERLREAVAEDSNFALATYYLYRASFASEGRNPSLEARALALSNRAPDRERLIVRAAIGMHQHDPAAAAIAETLVTRFPRDPEALVRAAEAMTLRQPIGARERDLLERAIAIDSAAGINPRAPCRLCDALYTLVTQLQFADSGAAAEATLRRWARLVPNNPSPIVGLALHHFAHGRHDEGMKTLGDLGSADRLGPRFLGRLLTGRLDEADAECQLALDDDDVATLSNTRWFCAIVWRNQGRYRDASALLFAGRLPEGRALRVRPPRDVVGEYVLDLESGRPRAAMTILESVVPSGVGQPTGRAARDLAWNLTRRGTAAVMARELDLARRLADSAETVGRGSLFGRDPLLHYVIRGLISQAANDHATAVDLFQRSIFSWNFGYTLANRELARSLLLLGRPSEAIAPLQAALRGGWDGSNLYVTRTELHELLAQAFAAVGRHDSAAAHYDVVERSWRRADPSFAARYQAASDYLARHGPRP